MTDPKSFNDIALDIPEDASAEVKLRLRAQMTIQAAFYAFGNEANRPGGFTLGRREISDVLAMSFAMLLAGDRRIRMDSDIRTVSEETAVRIADFTKVLKGEHSVEQMLAILGMRSTEAN